MFADRPMASSSITFLASTAGEQETAERVRPICYVEVEALRLGRGSNSVDRRGGGRTLLLSPP